MGTPAFAGESVLMYPIQILYNTTMNTQIQQKLIKLNKIFYERNAQSFSDTRQYWWKGWKELVKYFDELNFNPISILDLGCGNGRFGEFIKERYPGIEYTGIDFSSELIKKSENDIGNFQVVNITDLEAIKTLGQYDLVVMMAVLHHIPSRKLRSEIIDELYNHLKPDGMMVMTFWQFMNDKTLSDKVVPWSELEIDEDALEDGDKLLSWGGDKTNLRYCHNFSKQEQVEYLSDKNVVGKFEADGKTGQLNSYYLIRNS